MDQITDQKPNSSHPTSAPVSPRSASAPRQADTPIYIVTVLFNSAGVLERFMASLMAQTCQRWRLLAIDNASADGSADRLEALHDDRVHVLRNASNQGFARATNRGLRQALAEDAAFVILLNNDTAFEPDFLERFLHARDELGADVIAPRIMCLRTPERAWYAGGGFLETWVFTNVHWAVGAPGGPTRQVVDFASGCCLGLTGAILRRVGLLDERFFVYWEDTDFCLRLRTLGVPIHYVSDCVMLHDGSALSGGERSPGFINLYYRAYMQLLMKHFGMRYTITSELRLLMRHLHARDGNGNWAWPRMALAMTRGVVVALFTRNPPAEAPAASVPPAPPPHR